jgi:hypothetical protein
MLKFVRPALIALTLATMVSVEGCGSLAKCVIYSSRCN